MNSNFHIWTPLILKGKDGDTKDMIIGGLASTTSQDDDGEFLDPKGFDVSYFLDHGFFNWNHQTLKDPSAYVGRPTKAFITARGLEVEGKLFSKSEKAKQVYELAKTMQAEGLSLGFSIEGKALERDKDDPRRVLKARITGMAITPNPKNADAVLNIIKGHNLNTLSAYEDADEEEVEKAMNAGSSSGQAISKESLRDQLTVTEFRDEEVEKGCQKLTKGEVYDQMIERYPDATGQSLNRIYNLIVEQEKIMNMKKGENVTVSQEALNKAYDVVDELIKGYSEEDLSTTKEDDQEEEDDSLEKGMRSKSKKSDMKKSDHEDEEEEDDEDDDEGDDDNMSKGITPEHISAAQAILKDAGYSVTKQGEGQDLNKGIDDDLNDKSEDDIVNIVKGLNDDLKKSILSEIAPQLNGVGATALLIKGMKDEMGQLRDTVNTLKENTQGRRSVTAKPVERDFNGNDNLEKGNGDGKNDKKILSISRHKKQITDILEKGYWSDDNGGEITNKDLARDTQIFEVSNQLSKGIVDELGKQGYQLQN